MDMTQMNTRIGTELKQAGDEVLRRNGMTPSDAVRALWTYMAAEQKIPPCVEVGPGAARPAGANPADKGARIIDDFLASVGATRAQLAGKSYKEQRDEMYGEMLAEYEALNA